MSDRNPQNVGDELTVVLVEDADDVRYLVGSILGRDPRDIDGIWRAMHFEGAMRTTGGADMRVLSAINMAQLDILG